MPGGKVVHAPLEEAVNGFLQKTLKPDQAGLGYKQDIDASAIHDWNTQCHGSFLP